MNFAENFRTKFTSKSISDTVKFERKHRKFTFRVEDVFLLTFPEIYVLNCWIPLEKWVKMLKLKMSSGKNLIPMENNQRNSPILL